METVAWLLFIFTTPSNLFLKLCSDCGYVHGVLSDYLIPKLYLVDVVGLTILMFFFLKWLKHNSVSSLRHNCAAHWKHWRILWLCWLGIGILQTQSVLPILSIILWLKLTGLGLLAGLLASQLKNKSTSAVISLTLVFQSCLGLWQWLTQQSVAGYWLLGEPNLASPFGLAHAQFPWGEMILPYGTTAHPNVLAGFLGLGVLFLTYQQLRQPQSRWGQTWFTIVTLLALVVINLSQSASAQLCLVMGGTLLFLNENRFFNKLSLISWQTILVSFVGLWLLLAVLTYSLGRQHQTELSLYRRAYLIEASGRLLLKHPWVGSGLGTFTAVSEEALPRQEVVRFNQPVHHGVLLLLAELGLVGVGILLLMARQILAIAKPSTIQKLAAVLILLTPLIIWDHYLVSLETGQLLLLLSFLFICMY